VRSCIEVRDECPRATSGSRAITFCPPRSGDRPVFGAGTSRHEVSRTALLAPYLNRTTSWIRHQASITKTASQQFKVRLCPGFQETHSHFECHLGSSLPPPSGQVTFLDNSSKSCHQLAYRHHMSRLSQSRTPSTHPKVSFGDILPWLAAPMDGPDGNHGRQ
jgi:hypothetical protein